MIAALNSWLWQPVTYDINEAAATAARSETQVAKPDRGRGEGRLGHAFRLMAGFQASLPIITTWELETLGDHPMKVR